MCNPAASAIPATGITSCNGETPMPKIWIEPVAQGIAKPRGSLPKVNKVALSTTMPSATVAISQAFDPRFTNGLTAMNSTITP